MKGKLLTPKEGAAYLQVGESTFLEWLRSEKIPGIKVAGTWRIYEEDLNMLTQPVPLSQLPYFIGRPVVIQCVHPETTLSGGSIVTWYNSQTPVVLHDVVMDVNNPKKLDHIIVTDNSGKLHTIPLRNLTRVIRADLVERAKPPTTVGGPSSSAYNIAFSLIASDSPLGNNETKMINLEDLSSCADAALGSYDAKVRNPAPSDSELADRRKELLASTKKIANDEIIHYLKTYFLIMGKYQLSKSDFGPKGRYSALTQRAVQDAVNLSPPRPSAQLI